MTKRSRYSFLIAFLLFVTVVVLNRYSFIEMTDEAGWVDHTQIVLLNFQRLSNHLRSAQVYSADYAKIIPQKFYDFYKNEGEKIPADLARLKGLVSDNPLQTRRVDTLSKLILPQLSFLINNNIVELAHSGELATLKTFDEINEVILRAQEEENSLLKDRLAKLNRSTTFTSVISLVFSITAVVLIVLAFIVNLNLLRRRKWLEGFLESVLNTSRNGIITYVAIREKEKIIDYKIEFANAAILDMLNFDPKNIVGKTLLGVPGYRKDSLLMERFNEVVNTGQQLEFEDMYMIRDKPSWFSVLLAKRDDGVTASFHNITEIKKYQQDLQSNIRWLAESNKELEQYAYVASHDLQEPLRKIMVYGSLLQGSQKDKLDEKGMSLLSKINQSASKMSALIYDILNFSSIKRETHYVPVDLNETLRGVMQDLELRIEQSQAKINAKNLPEIDGLPSQLSQLFYNLISNSLKFARAGKPCVISIAGHEVDEEDFKMYKSLNRKVAYCKIIFSDNGIGFNQDYAEQIFGMFKRLNDRDTFPGSGIGLALCRKIVINHNGVIVGKGSEDTGATFIIILPQKQEHDPQNFAAAKILKNNELS